MKNDFNTIAPYYDFLAKVVFGKQLEKAQCTYLDQIQPGMRILIVGGGTGKVIEWLPSDHDLHVDYVELSENMITRAKGRNRNGNQLEFTCCDAMEVVGSYDLIIANFFLDCFSKETLMNVLNHLQVVLGPTGRLLVTDFYPVDKSEQRLLIRLMHGFFRLFSNLESSGLSQIHEAVKNTGFEIKEIQFFRGGSVFSAVYEKLSH